MYVIYTCRVKKIIGMHHILESHCTISSRNIYAHCANNFFRSKSAGRFTRHSGKHFILLLHRVFCHALFYFKQDRKKGVATLEILIFLVFRRQEKKCC